MGKLIYKQIASSRVKEKRNLVVSKAVDKEGELIGYAVSEQLVANEGETETKVFMKNGLGIMPLSGLIQCRDTLTEAIEAIKKENENKNA